ncbi:transmembrane protein 209-like [Uloborus diversus]|uniref:transmembrane protein 209-like n=1 Tax=Uloborus diversus TaxID=327109 RepID=UPI00240A8B8F|nr:transmembrane protein 209-like [Uloborus diversus]
MDSTIQSVRSKIFLFVHDFAFIIGNVLCMLYYRLYRLFNTSFVIESLRSLYYCFIGLFITDKRNLEWKTHWQSPVCRAILRRKYFMTRSKSSLSWSFFNFLLACLLIVELKNELIVSHMESYMSVVWYTELIIIVILTLNASVAFVFYIWSVFSKPMPISPAQKKLFRINDNDLGFEVKKNNDSISNTSKQEPLRFTSWRESLDCSSPSVLSITPLNYSANSWISSPESTNVDTTSSSFSFYRPSSPAAYTSTPKNFDKSYLRTINHGEYIESPYERPIKNKKQLEEFLKAHEEEDKKVKSFEESKAFMHNVTSIDNSPMAILGKCRYQRACRIPHMETTEDDSSEILCGDNVLHKFKITDKMLTNWCEHVRKWIGQTILVKLVQEIDDINSTLSQIGLPEFQIGTVSLFALHQIAVTKSQHLPTLSAILPYLDLHLNQEYLCRRLKDLAQGGCMGEFKWNSGGSYNDKQWCDDLPNDSAIIMHILCCYLDAHLPQEPHFPEGKPFSSKYFKKVPEKPVVSKDLHYIYQSSLNPPHFNVFLGEDTCTLKKGRSNLFCALVIFLHYLKTKECGMLGRVNLGPSGLNILWVLE